MQSAYCSFSWGRKVKIQTRAPAGAQAQIEQSCTTRTDSYSQRMAGQEENVPKASKRQSAAAALPTGCFARPHLKFIFKFKFFRRCVESDRSHHLVSRAATAEHVEAPSSTATPLHSSLSLQQTLFAKAMPLCLCLHLWLCPMQQLLSSLPTQQPCHLFKC